MKRSTVLTEKNRGTWATAFTVVILLPVVLSVGLPFLCLYCFILVVKKGQGRSGQVVRIGAEGHKRQGKESAKGASIQLSEDKLAEFGDEGWELVASFLEMETAFPNFGRKNFLAGIRVNVRPQTVVLIFRRVKSG